MKLIFCLFFCFASLFGFSQKKEYNYYYNRTLHLGVKGGVNIIKFDGKGWADGMKYGFHAGAFVQLKLTRKLSLQGEVLFSQLIADTAKDFTDVMDFLRFPESRSTIKFNYLDIPFLLNIGLDQINAIKLQLGVQYGLLLNKSQTILENGQQAFKTGQLSALGGIQFQLGPVNLTGRYLLGLDNLNNVSDKAKWKSQTAQISVGFTL